MKIDCSEVRRKLRPADILRVSDADVEAALEHARACPSCQVIIEEDRRIAQLIRDAVPRVQAPRELRERLYTALARERSGAGAGRDRAARARRWYAVGMLVTAGLAIGSAMHWMTVHSTSASAATAFAEDYLRRVVEQEELQSSERDEIASFFARELGVAMPPPRVPGFELVRATICLMNGQRGGVVEYSGRGARLTYYLLPRSDLESTKGAPTAARTRAETRSATALAVATERGLGVATWWDADHQHALVSDLPPSELTRLAPLFACPVSRL